jgi:tRNA 2-selenouridine synthase
MDLSTGSLRRVLKTPNANRPAASVEDVLCGSLPVIDVRAPREFARGHIPDAVNVPIFDDAEREEIGKLYKRAGQSPAIDRGIELAKVRADSLVTQVRKLVNDQSEFIVHCWRGGMRSAGFAWLFESDALQPRVLAGGYKAFRRAAHKAFAQPHRIVVLAGLTGSGKTNLLYQLDEAGEQVIDLEGLARHRGSSFGGLGQPPQPTGEEFENELFLRWHKMDQNRPLWIEGESRFIGRIQIPQPIWDQMSVAPMVFVEVDLDRRVEFLVDDYSHLPTDELRSAIHQIAKRLGGLRLKQALASLKEGDFGDFARQALAYYDKTYLDALAKRAPDTVIRVPLCYAGDPAAVDRLKQIAAELVWSPR